MTVRSRNWGSDLLSWGGAGYWAPKQGNEEYLRRGLVIWSSSLSAAAKVRAHNSWSVGVLQYTMPLIGWFQRELQQLDIKTRALLTRCGAHCPNASKDRLYLPRGEGGRGLLGVELLWEREAECGHLPERK